MQKRLRGRGGSYSHPHHDSLKWNLKAAGNLISPKLTWELTWTQQYFMCFHSLKSQTMTAWGQWIRNRRKERQWSHIKAPCWAVNLYMKKKQVVFFSWENTGHVLQESLHMRRVTWKPQDNSERKEGGGGWLTCESTEGVGWGLQAQGIQRHRLGQGLGLSLGQQLWERVWPGCGAEVVLGLSGAKLNNRLLRTQEDACM